jgi:DNA-binding response OmpR family regulator
MGKILIIDDDDATRALLRERLEGSHEIADTGIPGDAMAMALNFKPDCILLDLLMPALSGMELCQTLKSLSYTRSIPIFVISGERAEKYKDFCVGLGAKEYFEKPLNIEQLKESLAIALKLKQPQRRRGTRVQLRVNLKLCGTDVDGSNYEVLTTTENVSSNGFYCAPQAHLHRDSSAEVFMMTGGERHVGRARVVRTASANAPGEHYGFEFTEKLGNWIVG